MKLTEYEKSIIMIFQNATFKLVSAIDLYLTKYSYNESFFLCIIAQEELAKLVILPIARELGEMDEIVNNRSSAYYRHSIKQKIFTNFGLQNRTHDDIEKIKQSCLYVGLTSTHEPDFATTKPETVLKEIKYTALLLVNNYRTILFEETFPEKLKKVVGAFMQIVHGCIVDRLPEVNTDILKDADAISKKSEEEIRQETLKALFTNPYELIKIFKAAFGEKEYKTHLKKLGYFTIPEFEKYVEGLDLKKKD